MNIQHLRAFIWLRWRLRANQLHRGGIANAIVLGFFAVLIGLGSVGLFIGAFFAGLIALRDQPPSVLMFVWDGVVIAFLFTWAIVLVGDLQRSDALSLDRFLHLPVSPAGVFLVNYFSSLVNLPIILFTPAMLGLILGLVISHGPALLLTLPLLAAFLVAVSALSYQFQGWLASLMTNPRRRRTVVVLVTFGFILLSQLPNLVNIIRPWKRPDEALTRKTERETELRSALASGQLPPEEYQRQFDAIQKEYQQQTLEATNRTQGQIEESASLMNLFLPPGWLPLGAARLDEGRIIPALLGILGLGAIGGISLWRAYRTTLRLYTGQTGVSESKAVDRKEAAKPTRPRLLEWHLPWVSEPAAAVALAGFRSLTRAPEAKMMLLSPIIMIVIFGSLIASSSSKLPEPIRPLMASGAAAFVFLMAIQLVGNQFGYDRSGFRAFVLSPVPRREILLGKNLAAAPLLLGLSGIIATVVMGLYPMRVGHILATLFQLVSMYLLFCLLANALSILVPIPVAAGSIQPSNVRFIPILLHMVFVSVFPVMLAITLIPLGIEVLLAEMGWVQGVPIALLLSLVLLVAVWFGYRKSLTLEGEWLSSREQAILEVVTSKAEG